MTPERYKVRVTKDHLVFCCGHFISYEGSLCERLHGHNYRAAVEVEGPLDPANYYLFDFVALKHRTKALTDELDHHMLLATENPHIRVQEEEYLGKFQATWYRTLHGEKIDGETRWTEAAISRMRLKSFIARVTESARASSSAIRCPLSSSFLPCLARRLSLRSAPGRLGAAA